jgi:hypothetical protein
MTQALSGGAVALVLLVLWLLRRPRPQLMRSTDGASVAALNRVQMELVVPGSGVEAVPGRELAPEVPPGRGPTPVPVGSAGAGSALVGWQTLAPQPRSLRETNALLASLKASYALGGSARRQALETCLAWGHRSALPLLHLGLRDADPVVAGLAARGLDRFRGRSGPSARPAQAARLPRNVARTR